MSDLVGKTKLDDYWISCFIDSIQNITMPSLYVGLGDISVVS